MQVGQCLVVGHQAGVVGHLGIGPADLGSQQVIQRLGPRVEHLDLELPDPFLGRGSSVEIRAGGGFAGSQLLHRVREFVADLGFLGVEHRSSLGQSQFQVADLSGGRTHAEGQSEFESETPAGVVRVRESSVATGELRAAVVGEQVVTHGVDLVSAHEVQPRPDQAAGGLQLQFHAPQRPPMTPQLDTMSQGLDQVHFPVGFEAGCHRFIRGPEHRAIAGRQADQSPQCGLGAIEIRQGGLGLGTGLVITVPRQRLIGVGEALLATPVENHLRVSPRLLSTVASRHRRIPLAVRQVEIPVQILNVLDQVDRRLLELSQSQVVVDPGNHHALADSAQTSELLGNRSGDSSELGARSGQQRLAVPEIDIAGVGRVVEVERAGTVAAEIRPFVTDRETGSVAHLLAEHRLKIADFPDQGLATADACHEGVVLRRLAASPDHRRGELGVKRRQCRRHASATKQHTRFLDRRVPDRCDAIR